MWAAMPAKKTQWLPAFIAQCAQGHVQLGSSKIGTAKGTKCEVNCFWSESVWLQGMVVGGYQMLSSCIIHFTKCSFLSVNVLEMGNENSSVKKAKLAYKTHSRCESSLQRYFYCLRLASGVQWSAGKVCSVLTRKCGRIDQDVPIMSVQWTI